MDLSKAFDCISHDLLIAKLHVYGFSFERLTFLNSYLRNRKQCVKINNICSDFSKILSGVPQGSILGPILFNIFLNDLFLCLKNTDLHNFADNDTIAAVCDQLPDIIKILEAEGELSVEWFRKNETIVNSDKSQAIILNRKEAQATHELIIDNKEIKTTNSIKLLSINNDDQLKFNEHISILCSKAAMQLNALSRLQKYMGKAEKEAIINSFVLSNFNYCPLVWHFSSCESIRKIKKIQKRCLRIVLIDYESDYETLLSNSNKPTMEIRRLRTLAVEIFKALNEINPPYVKNIFTPKDNPKVKHNDIIVKCINTSRFGTQSLRSLGPKIWNNLPSNIKSEKSFPKIKEYIKTWLGPK